MNNLLKEKIRDELDRIMDAQEDFTSEVLDKCAENIIKIIQDK